VGRWEGERQKVRRAEDQKSRGHRAEVEKLGRWEGERQKVRRAEDQKARSS